jgi:1-acyl-sn-glycerol-3-phosphate acyltransferase
MFKSISKWILKASGWKVLHYFPSDNKCVIVSAPHTSMWDFWWARLYFTSLGGTGSVLVKKELFFFPFGFLLKRVGALPVYRDKKNSQVIQISKFFQNSSRLHLGIAVEGTRSRVDRWKRGFYYIAKESSVPVYLHKTDYAKKEIGIFARIELTNDIELDMKRLRFLYRNVNAKYPENFSTGNTEPFSENYLPHGITFL